MGVGGTVVVFARPLNESDLSLSSRSVPCQFLCLFKGRLLFFLLLRSSTALPYKWSVQSMVWVKAEAPLQKTPQSVCVVAAQLVLQR